MKIFLYGIAFFCLMHAYTKTENVHRCIIDDVAFNIPDSCECAILIPEGMDSSLYTVKEIFEDKGAIISGNKIMLFDDFEPRYMRIKIDKNFKDIQWTSDGICFALNDYSIFFVDDNGRTHVLIESKTPLTSFKVTNKGIWFVQDSIVNNYTFDNHEINRVIKTKGKISDIYSIDNEMGFLSIDKNIYFLTNGELTRVVCDSTNI